MPPGVEAQAGGFDADHSHVVVQEGMEQADRVRAAADAGDERVRGAALRRHHLFARLAADDRLEVAHHGGVGMGPGDGANQVECRFHVGHPVAQRLVHGVLQRPRAGGHGDHFGPEQLHAEDVGLLPAHVRLPHIDGAGETEERADGRRGDAVLAGAGLGDDPGLPHTAC